VRLASSLQIAGRPIVERTGLSRKVERDCEEMIEGTLPIREVVPSVVDGERTSGSGGRLRIHAKLALVAGRTGSAMILHFHLLRGFAALLCSVVYSSPLSHLDFESHCLSFGL
jgi:hypothetical protein